MALKRNPEIIYRGAPMPDRLRETLTLSGRYNLEMVRLLMQGLPISYGSETVSVVEYPDGRRIQVQQHDEFDAAGQCLRLRFEIVRDLEPAHR
jgi:hypothetical protein